MASLTQQQLCHLRRARHNKLRDLFCNPVGDRHQCTTKIDIAFRNAAGSKGPATAETAVVVYRAFELGLVLHYVGVNSNVLEFTPPLTMTKNQASEGVVLLDQAIYDVASGWVNRSALAAFAGW